MKVVQWHWREFQRYGFSETAVHMLRHSVTFYETNILCFQSDCPPNFWCKTKHRHVRENCVGEMCLTYWEGQIKYCSNFAFPWWIELCWYCGELQVDNNEGVCLFQINFMIECLIDFPPNIRNRAVDYRYGESLMSDRSTMLLSARCVLKTVL